MAVHFFFADVSIAFGERKRLKGFIKTIFKLEGRRMSNINYIFCSDKYLLNINQRFLKHDFYTDIITFDISQPNGPTEAEIYISVERVRDNAGKLKQSIKCELHRVIFHGVLHLCGYSDKSKKDEVQMRAMEQKYLDQYFL